LGWLKIAHSQRTGRRNAQRGSQSEQSHQSSKVDRSTAPRQWRSESIETEVSHGDSDLPANC